MTLHTDPPWEDSHLKVSSVENQFALVDEALKDSVKNKSFNLIQFEQYREDVLGILSELTWRHYIVYWSCRYAAAIQN